MAITPDEARSIEILSEAPGRGLVRALLHPVAPFEIHAAEAALAKPLPPRLKEIWLRYGWMDLRVLDAAGERLPHRGMTLLAPKAIVEVLGDHSMLGLERSPDWLPAVYCGGRDFLGVSHPGNDPDALVDAGLGFVVAPSVGRFLVMIEADPDALIRIRDEEWERQRPPWLVERAELRDKLSKEGDCASARAMKERLNGLDLILSQPLGRTQTLRLVERAIEAVEASGIQDMRRVMTHLSAGGQDRLDMSLARRLAAEQLRHLSVSEGPGIR